MSIELSVVNLHDLGVQVIGQDSDELHIRINVPVKKEIYFEAFIYYHFFLPDWNLCFAGAWACSECISGFYSSDTGTL